MLVHPLPRRYLLASGRCSGDSKLAAFELTAWFGEGHDYLEYEGSTDRDDILEEFEEEHCKGCDYYFDTYTDDPPSNLEDCDGNSAISVTYRSQCPCKEDGISYVNFPCAAGHDDPTDTEVDLSGPMPPMAYSVSLSPFDGTVVKDRALIQAITRDVGTDTWLCTSSWPTLNTYADGSICWGQNNHPESLPVLVDQFCEAPANADLVKPFQYLEYCNLVRSSTPSRPIKGCLIEAGCVAALLVSITSHSSAYLLLRGSGYPADDGVIAVGLHHHVHMQDGLALAGYRTTAIHGWCWFVLPSSESDEPFQAELITQIPDPTPCSSTPPSSSAPVALAAN